MRAKSNHKQKKTALITNEPAVAELPLGNVQLRGAALDEVRLRADVVRTEPLHLLAGQPPLGEVLAVLLMRKGLVLEERLPTEQLLLQLLVVVAADHLVVALGADGVYRPGKGKQTLNYGFCCLFTQTYASPGQRPASAPVVCRPLSISLWAVLPCLGP